MIVGTVTCYDGVVLVATSRDEWLTGTYSALGAEQCASARGVSTEMISTEQYEKMFGKKY